MNAQLLYSNILFFSIIFPLIFSFHKKVAYHQIWSKLLPALILPAILFCIWDSIFTNAGIWGFSNTYTIGLHFFALPLEEIMFFFCIPFSSVFIYYIVLKYNTPQFFYKYETYCSYILMALLFLVAVLNYNRLYTSITFFALSIYLFWLKQRRVKYLAQFYYAYIYILIPFFIVNGILTGTGISKPVVWYNNAHNLGIRLGTIPIEDIFYGMLLILMNVDILQTLGVKNKQATNELS